MGLFLRMTLLCSLLALPASADPAADRKLLADAIYSDSTLDAVFQVLIPVLSGSMETQFRNLGITISDPATFTGIFTEEFRVQFAQIIRADMADALPDVFTDQEVADIVAFLGTPSGAKFFAAQGQLAQLGQALVRRPARVPGRMRPNASQPAWMRKASPSRTPAARRWTR